MKCKKKRYESREEADADLNVIGPALLDFTMDAYQCRHCGFWHVGHRKPEMRKESDLRVRIQDIRFRLFTMRRPEKIKRAKEELARLQSQLDAITNAKRKDQ